MTELLPSRLSPIRFNRFARWRTGMLLAWLSAAVLLSACLKLDTINVGRAISRKTGQSGTTVSLRDGNHSGIGKVPFAWSLSLRSKFTPRLFQLAAGADASFFPFQFSRFLPFVRGGAHILQFEQLDDEFSFGAYSPYAQAGLMFLALERDSSPKRYLVTVGVGAEYDVRFTHQRSSGYVTFFIGLAYVDAPDVRHLWDLSEEEEEEPDEEPDEDAWRPHPEEEPEEEEPEEEEPEEEPEDADTKPKDADAEPKDADAKPKDADAKPKDADAEPKDADAKPKDADAEPKDADAKPKDADAEPKDADAKPKDADAKPKDADAKPKDADAKPKDADAKPKDADAKPKDADAKPRQAKPKETSP